jgi:hypothetical protein
MLSLRPMRALLFTFFMLTMILQTSCKKEDAADPMGRIFGQVLHHDDPILGANVYIKYNATEFPGSLPSDYDDLTLASEVDATFEFNDVPQGSHYLFGIGEDTDCSCQVLGGIPVILHSNTDTLQTIVPVTE